MPGPHRIATQPIVKGVANEQYWPVVGMRLQVCERRNIHEVSRNIGEASDESIIDKPFEFIKVKLVIEVVGINPKSAGKKNEVRKQ